MGNKMMINLSHKKPFEKVHGNIKLRFLSVDHFVFIQFFVFVVFNFSIRISFGLLAYAQCSLRPDVESIFYVYLTHKWGEISSIFTCSFI